MSTSNWFRSPVVRAVLAIAVLGYLFLLVPRTDWLANVGFLVLGVALAVATTFLVEHSKRVSEREDLARVLYEELAHQVARLCFDAEATWSSYYTKNDTAASPMAPLRLRKFASDDPLIYASSAGRVALLQGSAPGALIRFYYRASALRRDIESYADNAERSNFLVQPPSLRHIAHRQHEALRPGLLALEALCPMVQEPELIESAALAAYDEHRVQQSGGSLRERIKVLISRETAA